jgi:hypothetical protein
MTAFGSITICASLHFLKLSLHFPMLGTLLSMKHELRVMQAQGAGSIVNISSAYGHEGAAGASVYVASKHAVEGMTKSAALEAAPFGVRIKEIAHAIVSAASDKASTSSLSTAAGRRADTNTGPALGARRQGYYSPVCENLRHSRGLGRRAPVSEETRRVQNLRLAPEASETAGGIAGPEPGAGRARVTVWRFFSSVIVRKSTERKNQPEIASPTWRRTRVFVAGSKTTATFWILAIAVPTSVRSGRSDSADQCPDKPTNGPSEPDSAWACAEISKIADAITAFLRQLAEGFKEKTAMNLPFQFPCHGRSRAAVRL